MTLEEWMEKFALRDAAALAGDLVKYQGEERVAQWEKRSWMIGEQMIEGAATADMGDALLAAYLDGVRRLIVELDKLGAELAHRLSAPVVGDPVRRFTVVDGGKPDDDPPAAA